MAEMVNPQVSLPTLVLLVLTSLQLLIGRNWRLMLVSLAAQYLGAFALVSLSWPVNLAWVKLVAGWMACLLLLVAVGNTTKLLQEDISSSGRLFRLLAAGLVALAIISSTRSMQIWLPDIDLVVVLASLVLIGMGLLHLALTRQPMRTILAMLTALTGFEILYAAVESSLMVAGLLAGLTLAMAMAGAYLIAAPGFEQEPP